MVQESIVFPLAAILVAHSMTPRGLVVYLFLVAIFLITMLIFKH